MKLMKHKVLDCPKVSEYINMNEVYKVYRVLKKVNKYKLKRLVKVAYITTVITLIIVLGIEIRLKHS